MKWGYLCGVPDTALPALCIQKRKEQYEAELSEIERDIRMLERGESILVVED